MNKPLVICNGLIRSGSTWSFNVCRALIGGKSDYFSSEQLDGFVRNQWKQVDHPMVVKAHELGASALAALFSGRASAVCTYRDPRDCVASDLTFLNRDFEYSLGRIAYSFSMLRHYLANPNVLMVKYETMMRDPAGQIAQIAQHLQVPVDASQIEQINLQTGIAAARKVCDALVDGSEPGLVMDSHRVDTATQLHENHIFSGEIGRWRSELDDEKVDRVETVFAEWITRLGYA